MLLSPTGGRTNTPHQGMAAVTPAPSSTPSPASRTRINRRIDYSVRKARVRDGDGADLEDLQELLRMKEEECQEKEEEKRVLTARLKRIDQGLRDIERERASLFNKATRLESEKLHLKKELDNREREVKHLTKRCASEQKRVEESTTLRARNVQLSSQLESLQKRHRQERTHVETVQEQLKECREDRDKVLQRLKSLDTDFYSVREKLRTCLAQNEKLMLEKSAWEAEKQCLVQQAQLDLEQQLQSQRQTVTSLQNNLASNDEMIRTLKQIVQEKDSDHHVLKQRLTELENDQNHESRVATEDTVRSIVNYSQKENEQMERIQLLEESLQNKVIELDGMRQALIETKNQLEISKASLHAYSKLGSVENFVELCRLQHQNQVKLPFELEIRSARIKKLENALSDKDASIDFLRRSLSDITRELESVRLRNIEIGEELTHEVRASKEALSQQVDAKSKMAMVGTDLELCRSERDRLAEQLHFVEHQCSLLEASSKRLMKERCAWVTERQLLVEISEMETKQQRDELGMCEDTIQQLKGALQETESITFELREELKNAYDEAKVSRAEIDHLNASLHQLKERIKNIETDHLIELSGKDAMIMALAADIDVFLSRSMVAFSSIQHTDENNMRLEELASKMRSLQYENDSLNDLLHQSNVTVAELQAELLKEQIEKSLSTVQHQSRLGVEEKELKWLEIPIGDFIQGRGPDGKQKNFKIGVLQQNGLESDEDVARLTKALVNHKKERDELRLENQKLQESMENAHKDRRGLLVSLEKHAASVEKLKELEKSTLLKLAACQQDLEASQAQTALRDDKINRLESRLNEHRKKMTMSSTAAYHNALP